jgi:hypothetical protein
MGSYIYRPPEFKPKAILQRPKPPLPSLTDIIQAVKEALLLPPTFTDIILAVKEALQEPVSTIPKHLEFITDTVE